MLNNWREYLHHSAYNTTPYKKKKNITQTSNRLWMKIYMYLFYGKKKNEKVVEIWVCNKFFYTSFKAIKLILKKFFLFFLYFLSQRDFPAASWKINTAKVFSYFFCCFGMKISFSIFHIFFSYFLLVSCCCWCNLSSLILIFIFIRLQKSIYI